MPVDPARLASIPLFADLSEPDRAAIAAKLEERAASTGDHLSIEGGPGYFFFVIESGTATVAKHGATVAEFGPGDFFGEAAIFKTRRRTATVTVTSPTTVFAMFGADFAKIVNDFPALHTMIDEALSERIPE
jgi:CRP-like cAMP-binding protein